MAILLIIIYIPSAGLLPTHPRTIVSIKKIQDNIFATVKFVSDIISVKKDKNNNVVEGNPDRIKTVTDHWKFSKKVSSNSPNWYLAEILPK